MEFCWEIMELVEVFIVEDGLIVFVIVWLIGKLEEKVMFGILVFVKDYFWGMENMICLKDWYFVEIIVRVFCKILMWFCENNLEINLMFCRLIMDVCVCKGKSYLCNINLKDSECVEFFWVFGYEEEVEVVEIDKFDFKD